MKYIRTVERRKHYFPVANARLSKLNARPSTSATPPPPTVIDCHTHMACSGPKDRGPACGLLAGLPPEPESAVACSKLVLARQWGPPICGSGDLAQLRKVAAPALWHAADICTLGLPRGPSFARLPVFCQTSIPGDSRMACAPTPFFARFSHPGAPAARWVRGPRLSRGPGAFRARSV